MKLHLPISLRCSLLACFPTVHALFPTLAAGHVGGGLLAFAVSLAAVPSVQAAETSYANESFVDLTLNANDIVNFSGANTISGTLNMGATPITINLADKATTLTATTLQQEEYVTHTFNGSGTLKVDNISGKDKVEATFTGTQFYIGKNGTGDSLIGSGSTYTFKEGARFQFGASDPVAPTSRTFVIWSWAKDGKADTLLKLEDSAAYFGSNLEMKEQTFINLEGTSTLDVKGNLKLAHSDGGGNDIVTISSAEGSSVSANVNGNVVFDNEGLTLKLTGVTPLTVGGIYNSTNAHNTTLEVGSGSSASFGSFKTGTAATIQGGGRVTVTGNLDMAENASLTLAGSGTTVTVNGTLNMGFNNLSVHLAEGTTLAAGTLSQEKPGSGTLGGFTHTFTGSGTLEVADYSHGKDSMNVSFDATKLVLGKDGAHNGQIGSGSAYAFTNGASLTFGASDATNFKDRTFTLWSWHDTVGASSISLANSAAKFYGNLEMKEQTFINLEGTSTLDVKGNLKLANSGGGGDEIVTISSAEGSSTSAKVNGDVVFEEGFTLKLAGVTPLAVNGIYNSTNANNTVLDIASGSTATFGDLNVGTAATIQGGGHVTVNGDAEALGGHTLTVKGQGTWVQIMGGDDQLRSESEKVSVLNIGGGATLEANKVRATGQSLTVNGIDPIGGKGGTYKVVSYGMSMDAGSTTELYLNGGVTMLITGTDNGTAAGGDGSFVLGNQWGTRHNKIYINGSTLISGAAFSLKENHADINITNNGRLQLNGGLAYYGDDHIVTLTVDGTSTLGVVGNDKSGAEHIVLNLADGATVALGAEDASQTIFNHTINADAAAELKLCADGDARFDAEQPLYRQSLHVLAGKGMLELHGDYILGQLDNAIVNEGALSITEGTTFDLTQLLNDKLEREGSISGIHQFIFNAAGASLAGYVDHARIVYNGYVMNDEVTLGVNGSGGTLNFGDGHEGETWYWDGYSGATASGDWQHGSTLWSATEGTHGDAATGILDSVVFGLTPSGAIQEVQVGSGANGIRNMSVTEGGYTFNGEALKLGENLTVTATGRTTFNSAVNAAHGNVSLGNWEDAVLGITTEVTFGADLTAANLRVWNVASGAEEKPATGTYTFNNVNVSGEIHFHVNDQRMGGYNDPTPRVQVNGALTADSLLIDGNAAMEFDGKVTVTGTMTVLADNDDHNIVQLKGGSNIGHLVLDEGAKVLLSTDYATYTVGSVDLGDATLRFDAYNTTFSDYVIYSTHDNATLKVASITRNTINLLDGNKDNTGPYHSFSLYSQARTMNFRKITDLKDFSVYNGVAVIDANDASAGAIHGNLQSLEAAMLSVNANNIMAAGSGKVVVDNSYLHLKDTEQKLYANAAGTGNGMELDMAFVLGNESATGLHVTLAQGETAGVLNADYRQANNVSANVQLDSGTTLNLRGTAGASLTLSGVVSGAGNVAISGAGSSVTMSKADTNRQLTGLVTVENGSELTVAAQDALYGADVKLLAGGTLTLETGGKFPVRMQSLAFGDNATINIDSIQGTNVVDATAAAIWLQDSSQKLGYTQNGALTFNFTIADGASMNRMKAYNIFAGDFNFLDKNPTVGLHIFKPSVFYYNSKGERVKLASSRFVRGYLQQGDSWVYYIRTRAGNIWAGGDNGSGIWQVEGGADVWAGMEEGTKVKYDPNQGAALFVDVPGDAVEVTLSGEVKPGTAYFQAELTKYTLTGSEGNYLAADTIIDVRGSGGLTLNLAGNADREHAILDLYAYVGTTTLAENLAVSGETRVRYDAKLTTAAGKYILTDQYMAGGTFEKVTLGQKKIGGTADAIGSIGDADILPNTATNGATLEYVRLGGRGTLKNVTISEGVYLKENAEYTLSGVTFFDSSVTMAAGSSIALDAGGKIDIGGLDAEKDFRDPNSTTYTYKLLDGDLDHATGGIVKELDLNKILVDDVNLGTVKSGVLELKKDGAGLKPGEFKLVVKGADIMEWDPRWEQGGGPALGMVNTTDAVLYDKNGKEPDKYLYSNYVGEEGAKDIIVGSLSRTWISPSGTFAGSKGGNREIWVFNQGVGGFSRFVVGSDGGETQWASTHLVITGGKTDGSTLTVGGSYLAKQEAESFLTLHGTEESLERGIVIGGSWGSDQSKASHVFMDGGKILTRLVAGSHNGWVDSSWLTVTGGMIAEAYGGGYDDGSGANAGGVRKGTHSTIKGGTFTDFYGGSYNSTTNGGAHTIVTGGTFENLYGGGNGGTTNGVEATPDTPGTPAVELTVDCATTKHVYASGKAGEVNGDVVLNLLSGSAKEVYAGSMDDGNHHAVQIKGNYIVRLGSDFVFTNGNETDSLTGTLLYGGLQRGAGVTFDATHTSKLELVSENATYDFAGAYKEDDANDYAKHSTKLMGFKEVLLANGVTMIVHNAAFNNDQDLVIGMLGTETEGKSLSATVVYGNYKDVNDNSSKGDRTKSMTLKKGITLKLNTSYPQYEFRDMLTTPHLYVERGATFDVTGFPREQGINDSHGSIAFQLHLEGYGVDDKGALFKGEGFASSSPDGKAALGHVILDDNASVNADGANIIFDYADHENSFIEFNRHTLTKIGSMVLRLYHSNEGLKDSVQADGTTQRVTQGGTMYVQEGAVDYRMENQATEVDYVLGSKGTLSVTFDEGSGSLSVKSLSGVGTVRLNPNTTLSIHSDFDTLNSTFYKDWMDTSEKYSIYSSGGYVYGVFSGKITSEDGSSSLIKTGEGTQALLGDKSDYKGLTIIQDGTLYLMGSSHGQLNGRGLSATITSGAAGQSSLVWENVTNGNPEPVLRLGHGTVTYNDGYARGGEDMLIEVAAAPNGVGLDNFKVRRGYSDEYVNWVSPSGKTYLRVDVSSIKSVNVNGLYADGSAYVAGTDIDRSRALYVSQEDLEKRVSADLNTEQAYEMFGSMEGEQLDSAKLSNGMKLDCNAYYGDGSICAAGNGLNLDWAQQYGVYVPSDVSLSPETADLLLYKASPLVYARTTEGADGAETTTYYTQYELKTPMGPGEVGQASTSQTLRQDAVYYVRYVEINNRKTQMFTVYLTYAELQTLLKGEAIGDKNFADCELVSINRICVDAKDETYNAELARNENVELIVGEVSTVVADVPLELQGYTVKEGVTKLSCNGYYVDARNIIVGRYLAGDEIKLPEGAVRLLVPEMFKDQAWAVVTGLSPTGYEEAVYSGMLTDDGKTASHLTKRGAGTLVLDQQSIYTGDTKLEGGTLRLRGWGDLQNGMDRRGSGRFIQSAGTSLMLSYANEEKYTSLGDAEVRELRKDLVLVGTGDSRWRNEAETDYQTAALISDVGQDVSFTLSGVLSGDGNLLHSGEGQLHISGANTYEGGTTVTKGVTYVESSTALGTTAQGASPRW